VEQKNFKEQPENFKALFTPEFGDQLFVKYHRDGKWSEPVAVTDPKQDLVRCAVACDGDGMVHVLYSINHEGQYDLCVRTVTPGKDGPLTLGKEKALSQKKRETPALTPVACTASDGSVRVGYQENLDTGYVHLKKGDVIGTGGVASGERNHWGHAIAAGPDGAL